MNQIFGRKNNFFTNNRNIGVVKYAPKRKGNILFILSIYMNDMIGLWYKTKIEYVMLKL